VDPGGFEPFMLNNARPLADEDERRRMQLKEKLSLQELNKSFSCSQERFDCLI